MLCFLLRSTGYVVISKALVVLCLLAFCGYPRLEKYGVWLCVAKHYMIFFALQGTMRAEKHLYYNVIDVVDCKAYVMFCAAKQVQTPPAVDPSSFARKLFPQAPC